MVFPESFSEGFLLCMPRSVSPDMPRTPCPKRERHFRRHIQYLVTSSFKNTSYKLNSIAKNANGLRVTNLLFKFTVFYNDLLT